MNPCKNLRIFVSLTFFLLLFTTSCAIFTQYSTLESSARNSYRRGDYDKAVLDCAQALKINPEYEKALTLIQDAHKAALTSHDNKISVLKQSEEKFKWDQLVSEYESLIMLREALLYLPVLISPETGDQISLPVPDYSGDLKDAKENAAEGHYQEGLALLDLKGIDNSKQAAKQFKLAQNFVANYKDASARYEEARAAAVLRLAIIPFEDKSGKTEKYGAVAETIIDETIERIMGDRSATEFLEIITRDELDHVLKELKLGTSGLMDQETAVELGNMVGAHKILTGKITQIIYTPIRTVKKRSIERTKVPMPKTAMDILKKWYDQGNSSPIPHNGNWIWKRMHEISQITGISFSCHDLRRLSGQILVKDSKSKELARQFYGHSDISVTEESYADFSDNEIRYAQEIIEKELANMA